MRTFAPKITKHVFYFKPGIINGHLQRGFVA